MAEASISVDQDQLSCPVCLDLLQDPVTIPCGHSFCVVCVNGHWNKEDQKKVYSCPQCRNTFVPRPVLGRNYFIAEMLEKLKRIELQSSSAALCLAGPGDVECDSCTGRKRKAVKTCLVCLASFCKSHVKPHHQSPAYKKHKLVDASTQLQEMICSHHCKLMEIYCRTDQSWICYLCTMDEHKGHDTVSAAAERTQKQAELKEERRRSQQRLRERQEKVQELKEAVNTIQCSAKAAVEDSEKIFTEMIRSLEEKRSEVTGLIRDQENIQLSLAEELLEQLEQEITDLKRRNVELEELSHKEDHLQFLKVTDLQRDLLLRKLLKPYIRGFQSLYVSSGLPDSPDITINPRLSFDGVRKSLSDLKERLEELSREDFVKVYRAVALRICLPSEPNTREDFLHYFHQLTLDPSTANRSLIISEDDRLVRNNGMVQQYPDHPERFDSWPQVLCKESIHGRCYWEVEWSNEKGLVSIAVSYKEVGRKGWGNDCSFGRNDQSWSLECCSSLSFWHNNIKTEIPVPSSSRVGVYLDHGAGIVSFYSVSDTMTLLHTVHTTFTRPLHAGIRVEGKRSRWAFFQEGFVRLCEPI